MRSRICGLGPIISLTLAACSAVDSGESVEKIGQALEEPSAVLSFEDPSYWSASSGTKSASTDVTNGAKALALANVSYAELTSVPLSSLGGVTSTLAVDLKLPAALEWGQLQLFVNIPSQGIYNLFISQVALAGLAAGSYQTLSFALPNAVLTALGQAYSDLTFTLTLIVPQQSQAFLFDNLRFVGGTSESIVKLNVSNVDDFVYLTVNGIRRRVVPINETISELDVSSWFKAGANSVRVQTANTGGPAGYAVELRVDGASVISASCADAPCDPATEPGVGIVFDQSYTVNTPNRPPGSTLNVNGTSGGKIYLNDAYTGQSAPASFSLPQGTYTVGLGVGEGTPGAYAGQFHEQSVTLGASALSVTPSNQPALALPNHTRVALLPIRETIHGDGGPTNTGILSDEDISVMHGQTLATRDAYVAPFSYGLTTWDVELLPTVEDTPLYRNASSDASPDVGRFLNDANLTSLEQTYDIVIYFFSKYTASGDVVANDPCCFWGGGQLIAFPNHLTRDPNWPATRPNVFLLHESLHDYESYNHWRLHLYNGADGLHGGGQHGYVQGGEGGEEDFLLYYRRFMRNQVAEINTMRGGVTFNQPRPTNADLWVGVFDTMRRDVDWSASSNANLLALAKSRTQTLAKERTITLAPAGDHLCALPAPKQ